MSGALSATAAQLKDLRDGGVTITGSGSVVIDNYTGQDISSLTNAGIKLTLDIDGTDISLTTANLGDLNNITAIQVAESTSVVLTSQLGASLATKFASENSSFGELKFSGYSNQDLAPIAHNFIVNVTSTSEGAVTLDPAKLNDVDKLAISASTNASLSTDADATDFTSLTDAGSLEVQSNGTLALSQANAKKLEAKLSGTGQVNVSAVDATVALNIADTLDVGVTLADNGANAYTINHTNLAKADRINVSGSDVFTVTSSDNSAVDLEQLKSLNLSSGADLKVEPGATSEIPNLQAITGTSEAGEEATFTTASDSASVNLSKISDIAGLDSFTIDANTNNTTLSLRLSETLSRSSSVAVNLDSTNNNRDFIYVETNMATAHAGDQAYDSSTTWASLGLGGLAINNFVPDKDTFGVVDSDDNIVLKNLATSFPSDGNFSSNGKPYLDIMDFRDLDNVEDIRKYIADKITRTDQNTDLGFAVLGTNGDNIDIGIFHAKWTGADGADPSEKDSDLKVARLGVLSNVDADSTLSLTNAIKARFLFATSLPTGLES